MILHTTTNQDTIIQKGKAVIFSFSGVRHVLSSSVLNGGFRKDLQYVFNFDEKPDDSNFCEMEESTYEEHLVHIAANKLDLNPHLCSGLSTAADMENLVIETKTVTLSNGFPLTVTAAVTAGIDQNGARPGDPACWEEYNSSYRTLHPNPEDNEIITKTEPGTINILLHINAALTEGTMVRAVITGSEAKAVACSELLCPSLYSEGIATGSGTDGMIVISDPSTDFNLTAAGKDSQLGEIIGTTIIKAVKKAIGLQTDVTPQFQHHVLKRLDRFGVSEETLYAIYANHTMMDFLSGQKTLSKEEFLEKAKPFLSSGYWTAKASLLAHLLDQLAWGMLSINDINEIYPTLLKGTCPGHLDKDSLIQAYCMEFVRDVNHIK